MFVGLLCFAYVRQGNLTTLFFYISFNAFMADRYCTIDRYCETKNENKTLLQKVLWDILYHIRSANGNTLFFIIIRTVWLHAWFNGSEIRMNVICRYYSSSSYCTYAFASHWNEPHQISGAREEKKNFHFHFINLNHFHTITICYCVDDDASLEWSFSSCVDYSTSNANNLDTIITHQ